MKSYRKALWFSVPSRRAQVVLLAQAGYETTEIAQIICQSYWTVRRWLHRFMVDGCEGLWEGLRSGRPPEITPAETS
ncbi:MAG: helix-turn-helix domain-containing protein [Chloroflexota bacterium]